MDDIEDFFNVHRVILVNQQIAKCHDAPHIGDSPPVSREVLLHLRKRFADDDDLSLYRRLQYPV